jgi:hypothetical protein
MIESSRPSKSFVKHDHKWAFKIFNDSSKCNRTYSSEVRVVSPSFDDLLQSTFDNSTMVSKHTEMVSPVSRSLGRTQTAEAVSRRKKPKSEE